MVGFPGDPVVKNLPCNARDTGSIPTVGRSHMPHTPSPLATTGENQHAIRKTYHSQKMKENKYINLKKKKYMWLVASYGEVQPVDSGIKMLFFNNL